MAASYSLDLRRRVMQDVDAGMSVAEVAVKFSVTEPTVYDWIRLRQATGHLKPRKGAVGPKRKLEMYKEEILEVIDENSSVTLEQISCPASIARNRSDVVERASALGKIAQKMSFTLPNNSGLTFSNAVGGGAFC